MRKGGYPITFWLNLSFLGTCVSGLWPSQVFPRDFFSLTVSFPIYFLMVLASIDYVFCFVLLSPLVKKRKIRIEWSVRNAFPPPVIIIQWTFLSLEIGLSYREPSGCISQWLLFHSFSSFSYHPLLLYDSLVDEVIRYAEVNHSIILWLNFCVLKNK